MGTVIELVKLNDVAIQNLQNDPDFWYNFSGTFYEHSTRKPYLFAINEPFYLYLDKVWQKLHYVLCPTQQAQSIGIFLEESHDPLSWSLAGKTHLPLLDEYEEYPTRYNTPKDIEQILMAFKAVDFGKWEAYCNAPQFESSKWIAHKTLYDLEYLQKVFGWVQVFYEQALNEQMNVLIRSY